MYLVAQIMTADDNMLRMVSDTFFPSLESAKKFISTKIQKQADDEAQHMYERIKVNEQLMEDFKKLNSQELVVKNFIIIPIAEVVQVTNKNLF